MTYINITTLGKEFSVSPRKMNNIISELGWIEHNIKGWKLTKFGEQLGGQEFQHTTSGATYTKWPTNIKENKFLIKSIGPKVENIEEKLYTDYNLNFRDKFPAKYRSKDGHKVRSRGELLIDEYLYDSLLVHSYERKLPIEEECYSDFYIPSQNGSKAVYIEYWGIENKKKYQERKEIKREIYKKYHLNLIELENKHIDNLDDYLPRMLLDYGIKVD